MAFTRDTGSTLWRWTKIIAVIALVDVVLFHLGIFWHLPYPTTAPDGLRPAYRIARAIHGWDDARPVVAVVGSSIVRSGVREPKMRRTLATVGQEHGLAILGIDGARSNDIALIANEALAMKPWLVVIGTAMRDYAAGAAPPALRRVFYDSSLDLPDLPRTLEQELTARLSRYWSLFRYRTLARVHAQDLLSRLTAPRAAHAARFVRRFPKEDMRRFKRAFLQSSDYQRWKTWEASQDPADYLTYLEERRNQVGQRVSLLAAYRRQNIGNSPRAVTANKLAALDAAIERIHSTGARAMVVFFPENPFFLTPTGQSYYDREGSDLVASELERRSRDSGARFVDLRRMLPTDAFLDMIHTNTKGTLAVSERLATLVGEEWEARVASP